MLFTKVLINMYFFYFLQIMSVLLTFLKETSVLIKFFPIFIIVNFITSYFYLFNEDGIVLKNKWIMMMVFMMTSLLLLLHKITLCEDITVMILIVITQIMIKFCIDFFTHTPRDKIYICMSLFMIFISSIHGLFLYDNIITISLFSIGVAMMPLNFLLSFTRSYYDELGFYINWVSIASHIITIIFLLGCGRVIDIFSFHKINMICSFVLLCTIIYLAKFATYQPIERKHLQINKEFLYTLLGFIVSVIILHYARIKLTSHINFKHLAYIFLGKIVAALWFLYMFKGEFKKGNEKLLTTCVLLMISICGMSMKFKFALPWLYMGIIEVIGGFLLPVYVLVYAPQYLIITSGLCNIISSIIIIVLNKIFLF